jgi:hypothetical protein
MVRLPIYLDNHATTRADPRVVIFTSGATEGNNLAIKGAARLYRPQGERCVDDVVGDFFQAAPAEAVATGQVSQRGGQARPDALGLVRSSLVSALSACLEVSCSRC